MGIKELLETIKSETRPIEGHADPRAIEDCWREVFEEIDTVTVTDGTILSLEKVRGRFRCDFCHEESRDLVKLRFPGVIFTPCPKCLKKIQKAIQAWYNWCQETLVEKLILETMKSE